VRRPPPSRLPASLLYTARPPGDTEQSHIPTADAVFRVFNAGAGAGDALLLDGDTDIEEIDFADLHKVVAEIEERAVNTATATAATTIIRAQDTFTGFYVDTAGARPGDRAKDAIAAERVAGPPLGLDDDDDDDDDVIVYVAPHPRNGPRPAPDAAPLANVRAPSCARRRRCLRRAPVRSRVDNAWRCPHPP
jgi:hypothetical protein